MARAVLDAAPGSLCPQTLATLVSQVVTKTRQYAKRQTTWLGSAAVDCTVTGAEEQLAFVEQFS
jgi:tRNA A37 N6-isopentenylltransferase MiaA